MTEPRQGCELPKWTPTKKGRRCGQVCTDENGRKRFRFVSGQECGGKPRTKSEEVTEFAKAKRVKRTRKPKAETKAMEGFTGTFDMAQAVADTFGVPLERLEPMPLIPLVGFADGIEKRRSRS